MTANTVKGKKKQTKKSPNVTNDLNVQPPALGIIHRVMKDQTNKFFLHAATLSIPAYNVSVEAELPSWWKASVKELQK